MSLATAADVSLSYLPLLVSKHWISAGVIFPESNPLQSGGFSGFGWHRSIELVMPSNHLILSCPHLLLPSIFSSIRVFSNKSVLRKKWPKFRSFSFSTSSSNEYSGFISFKTNWFDSLLSKGLSRVFSNTTVQKHPFLVLSLLYDPTLTSIHDYWKNKSFDYMDLCQQSEVSAF